MSAKKRPEYRYELLTCAWRGHELVGAGAAEVTPADALVVRDLDGVRWCRCLRCDAWLPMEVPAGGGVACAPARRTRLKASVPANFTIEDDAFMQFS